VRVEQVHQFVVILDDHLWIERLEQFPGTLRLEIMLAFDNYEFMLPDRFLQLGHYLFSEVVQIKTCNNGSKLSKVW
jgi:hypothetical protein